MTALRIGITGIAGRMGKALVRETLGDEGLVLAGGSARAGHPLVGRPVPHPEGGAVRETKVFADPAALAAVSEVIIDFTHPAALAAHVAAAEQAGAALVVGTTGLEAAHLAALRQAARRIAIVHSANMSLGVNLIASLVREAAARLGPDWDIEILEMHHRHKVDAPSGTALMLGRAAAAGRGVALEEVMVAARGGESGARAPGAIGFAVLRGGSVAGEHSVIFAGEEERLELSHKATSRSIFARGALAAARWLKGRPPGLYSMADVLEDRMDAKTKA
ncbi:MAG: 4-hydroxy-tetrahydrodipicolinate reductase [Pseudomonadota bacterium]